MQQFLIDVIVEPIQARTSMTTRDANILFPQLMKAQFKLMVM